MWRTPKQRTRSAQQRLKLAREIWGWTPHPKQRELFCSPAQVTVAACGRRWGKSECLSMDLASLALAEWLAGHPCRQLVVAPTDVQTRLLGNEVQRLLLTASVQERLQPGHLVIRQRPALTITFPEHGPTGRAKPNGTGAGVSVMFRTAGRDGRGMRGLWAHRIVVDEAAYVPDSVLSDVLMPMLLDRGGDYILASSPSGRRSAYYRLWARAMSAATDTEGISYQAFQFPTSGNPHLDLAFLQSQQEEMGAAMFAQEYEARFVDDAEAVFQEEDIDGCLCADPYVSLVDGQLVSEPVPGHLYTIGIDWGRKLDFTVVAVLDSTEVPARLVGLWRWQRLGWEAQISQVAQIIAQFQPWAVLADGNSIGDPLIERLGDQIRKECSPGRHLPPITRFMFGMDSKQMLVDRLTLRMAARSIRYPASRALLAELRSFEYGASGVSGRPRMGARSGAHDDCVVGLALAVYAAPDAAPVAPSERLLLGSNLRKK